LDIKNRQKVSKVARVDKEIKSERKTEDSNSTMAVGV
jgi:hypothetical protein